MSKNKKGVNEKELEKKYKDLFKDIVGIVQKEENISVVYQVLVDILMQIEKQVRSEMGGGCSTDCSSCSHCDPSTESKDE